MRDKSPQHLAKATDVDVDAFAAALLAGKSLGAQNPGDLVNTMVCRTLDAHAGMMLDLARKARDGKLAPAGDVVPRPVAFPTPWQVGFALERPGAHGILFVIDLDIPVDQSPSLKAEVERRSEALRTRLTAEGRKGADLDREVLSAAIFDEMRLEDEARRGKLPDDLPDPDEVSRISQVWIARYAPKPEAAPADEGFEAFAARVRPCVGQGLDAVVDAIAKDGYVSDIIAETSLAYSSWDEEDGGRKDWSEAGGARVDPAGWAEAFARLAVVARADGQASALLEGAREVGGRLYKTHREPGDRALAEIGAALALRDGGLPGPEALAWIKAFEGKLAAARLSDGASWLGEVAEALEAAGHTDQESRFDFNDLDDTLFTTGRGEGPEALTLTGQNGSYLVLLRRDGVGEVAGFDVARFGLPLDKYLSGDGYVPPTSLERMGYTEFHRHYANPRDPAAPLPRDEALAALAEGRADFPGFLARMDLSGATPRCEAMGSYSTLTIKDIGNVAAGLEVGALALEEEYGGRSAPGMR